MGNILTMSERISYLERIKDLESENANHKELLRTYATEIADLKSQLADIKYLNADEVEKIVKQLIAVNQYELTTEGYYTVLKETTQAICKLALPDIDNEVGEPVTGKPALCPIETKDIYYSDAMLCSGGGAGIGYKHKVDREKIIEVLKDIQKTYGKCFDLIEEEELSTIADEVIKALEGK